MRVLLFANTDWYLFNFRRFLARFLREQGCDVLLVSPPGPYGERLREMGFRWEPVAMDRRSLNPLRELLFIWRLRKLFLREKPDVVHGFTIKCAVYGSVAARLAGIRARVNAVAGMGYVFISDSFFARGLRPFVRVLMRFTLSGKDARLILQNPDDQAFFLTERIVPAGSIRLIPGSGVDCNRFYPLKDTSRESLKVLLPARLLWDKGVAEFIEAARLIKRTRKKIEFVLAGVPDSGNPSAVPDENIKVWVDEGLLTWLGHVEDMPELFRSVDIVALPSYREGLPKGLIEAAASGCALVTTDAPGCREVVTHEVDGLIVPVKNAKALAVAIERLAEDASLRRRLGQAAREKALRQFDEPIIVARTIDVYKELLGGRFADENISNAGDDDSESNPVLRSTAGATEDA